MGNIKSILLLSCVLFPFDMFIIILPFEMVKIYRVNMRIPNPPRVASPTSNAFYKRT